jgi:hypothetical protein
VPHAASGDGGTVDVIDSVLEVLVRVNVDVVCVCVVEVTVEEV